VGVEHFAFRPKRCTSVLREAFQTYAIVPGAAWGHFLSLQNFLEIHQHDDEEWNNKHIPKWLQNEQERLKKEEAEEGLLENEEAQLESSWKRFSKKLVASDRSLHLSGEYSGLGLLLGSVIAWLSTVFIFLLIVHAPALAHKRCSLLIIANVGLTLTVACSSVGAVRLMPQLAGNKMVKLHGAVFIIGIYVFSVCTMDLVDKLDMGSMQALMSRDTKKGRGVFYNNGTDRHLVTPYPVCGMSWGTQNAPVRVLDLAAMSNYAYVENETEFKEMLHTSFPNATSLRCDKFKTIPRIVAAKLCGPDQEAEPCTIIVAVKGTSNRLEIMTDLGMFTTVALLQMLDKVAPLLGTLPKNVVSYIIRMFEMPFMKDQQNKFVENITEVVEDLKKDHPNDAILMTGHSLGGKLAESAATNLGMPAVGFSAPGQFLVMMGDTGRSTIEQNIVTIVPRWDLISHLAQHLDIVQRIQCRTRGGDYRKAGECHFISTTSCELWRVCGDIQYRNFSKACLDQWKGKKGFKEALVNEECLGQPLNRTDTQCR